MRGEGLHRAVPSVRERWRVGTEKREAGRNSGCFLACPPGGVVENQGLAGLGGIAGLGSGIATCVTPARPGQSSFPAPPPHRGWRVGRRRPGWPSELAMNSFNRRLLRTCGCRLRARRVPWVLRAGGWKQVRTERPIWESQLCAPRVPQPEVDVVPSKGARHGRPLRPRRATFGIPSPRPFPSIHLAGSISRLTLLSGPSERGLAKPGSHFLPLWSRGRDFTRGERRCKPERRQRAPPGRPIRHLFLPIPISRQHLGRQN